MDERLAIQEGVEDLFETWCDRRCVRALREILRGYPLTSGLSDDWHQLRDSLGGVRAFAKSELKEDELARVETLIIRIDVLLAR